MSDPAQSLPWGTLEEAAAALRRGETTSEALTAACLARIEAVDPALGSFLRQDPEGARSAARASDARRAEGRSLGLLDGIPLGIKDQIVTRGLETTAGSRILEGFVPTFDATVVARLRAAGAVIVGKNNQDELAMGSSTERSGYFPCKNPHDLDRVPGGSSGGSAAAVAAGLCFGSLGTDTGGSIRQPASFCGVVGLKPTYGRVSRFGAIAFASSLDQVGPLARTVRDAAVIYEAIAGPDPRDSTAIPTPAEPVLPGIEAGVEGLRIGLIHEAFHAEGLDPSVEGSVRAAAAALEGAGARLCSVAIPSLPYSVAAYYLTATAEASSNLARFDGVRYGRRAAGTEGDLEALYTRSRSEGFGPEVKRRILLGTYALSAGYYDAYYLKAQRARTVIAGDLRRAFESCDALLMPTSPVPPFRLGERTEDPLAMYLADIYTIACNLAGLPGLSVPVRPGADGLPVGLQLLAPAMEEGRLLRIGRALEHLGHGYRRPAGVA